MTDITSSSTSTNGPEFWRVQAKNRERLAVEACIANKEAIFAALARAGITMVSLRFDGSGDSGQIEEVTVLADGLSVTLPSDSIEIARPAGDDSGMEHHPRPLREAIEDLAYEYLDLTHYGWEIGDGGYGEFTFDVAGRLVSLDCDERYAAIENYQHEF